MICSLDGYDEESYKVYRVGGDFELVKRNLKILSEGVCNVLPQFLINPDNKAHIDKMRKFVAEMNIPENNIHLKTMNMNFLNKQTEVIPGVCHSMHQGLYFNVDGIVQPCCVNIGRDLRLLHISNFKSTEGLLNHPKIVEVRQNLAKDKNQYASCTACEGHDFREDTVKVGKKWLSSKISRKSTHGPSPSDSPLDSTL